MKSNVNFFSGLYIFTYAAIGALFPLIAQYLYSIGFSGSQIGIITALSTAIGILSNSLWGGIYHRRHRSKKIILLLCILTALLSLLLMAVRSFWIFLILYVIVFFFENPVFPLIDSTVMEENYPFGSARMWGSVGFATGIGIAGAVAERFGLLTIFPMFSVLFLLTALLVGIHLKNKRRSFHACDPVLPDDVEEYEDKMTEKQGGYKDLLHNGKYIALLSSTFFFSGPALSHNTYFSFLYKEAGGTIAGMGLVLLLMALSETPFMAFAERIASFLTTERAIFLAMTVSTLRFLWYGTNPSAELLAATFILQGIANGIGLVEIVKYIAKLSGPAMISLAIPLYTAVSSNCGAITCQFLGGIIVEDFGGRGVYLFYGLFNLIGLIIYLVSGLHKPAKGKSHTVIL